MDRASTRKDVAALVSAIASLALVTASLALLAAQPAGASVTPNDPGFSAQWGDENTGQPVPTQSIPSQELGPAVNGTPLADISAADAWAVTTGSPSIVIGEVDSGVAYEHLDLAANIWSNPGLLGCVPGTHGFNVLASGLPSCEPRDEDGAPFGGHGSHVAGIMGAVGNNATGVAGINWHTSILPVKWLEDESKEPGTTEQQTQQILAKALEKVVEVKEAGVNVRVVNDSAVFANSISENGPLKQEIQELGKHEILFVTAAGNGGINNDALPHYPCSYHLPNEICVAASSNRDELAGWASYGPHTVDLAAPGASIYSTLRNGQYAFRSGSSMAAAQVSGAAALILSTRPSLTVAELKADILGHVDRLKSLEGKVASGGRLDVCNAIPGCTDGVPAPPPPPPPPKPPPPPPPPPPVLSALKIVPSTFKAATRGASISSRHAKPGAIVRYNDSEPALSEFSVLARRAGVLNRAKKCVGGRRARARRGKRCVRYVSIGSFKRADVGGVNRFHFSGRLGRRKLPPGRYRLQGVPVFSGVTGTTAAASFRIIS